MFDFFKRGLSRRSSKEAATGAGEQPTGSQAAPDFSSLSEVKFAGQAEGPTPELPTLVSEPAGEPIPDRTQDMISGKIAEEIQRERGEPTGEIKELGEADPNNPKLKALVDFLRADLRIKTELLAAAPTEMDDYSPATRMDYLDRLDDTLKSIRTEFRHINQTFGSKEDTERFFRARREGLAVSNFEAGTPARVYQAQFSDMRPDFVDQIDENSCGYALFGNPMVFANQATTVNEYLHVYHNGVMNSETLLQGIPALAERRIGIGTTTLRGEDSAAAREIFEEIPASTKMGDTEIVSAAGQVILMVRDRGHALTVSVSRGDKNYEINYHIPVVKNQAMVKALPGIGRVTSRAANGSFDIPYDEVRDGGLGLKIADFISRVPGDFDSEAYQPGGRFYTDDSGLKKVQWT